MLNRIDKNSLVFSVEAFPLNWSMDNARGREGFAKEIVFHSYKHSVFCVKQDNNALSERGGL